MSSSFLLIQVHSVKQVRMILCKIFYQTDADAEVSFLGEFSAPLEAEALDPYSQAHSLQLVLVCPGLWS